MVTQAALGIKVALVDVDRGGVGRLELVWEITGVVIWVGMIWVGDEVWPQREYSSDG